jgi:hypothetical protein
VEVQLLGPVGFDVRENHFDIVHSHPVAVHLAGATPQNAAGAKRDNFGVTAFFITTFQDNAKLVAIMGMRSARESRIERHCRHR